MSNILRNSEPDNDKSRSSEVSPHTLRTITYCILTLGNVQKSKTAYNERVVASTPVLTAEQRRHLQELQKKENSLKQQIQLLQQEYDNLEVLVVRRKSYNKFKRW